ncbi:hypothetical protein FB451DRAFT_1532788 [Mycena latifolia]|nr:hypothetical protein FB451DRAFT_1532788 [Mycena latifolia]
MATDDNGDSVHQFLMECHKISTEAQFTVDSLPNAETPAVERVTHQLDTIRDILLGLNDPHLSGDTLEAVIAYVTILLSPLENFLSHPPLPARAHIPRENMCWPAKWPAKWPHMAHFTIAGRAGVSRDVSGTKFPQPALDSELVQPLRLLRGSMGREKRDSRDKPTHHQVMIAACALLHGAAPRHRTDRRLQVWGAVISRVLHRWVISRVFHYRVTWVCSGPFRVFWQIVSFR